MAGQKKKSGGAQTMLEPVRVRTLPEDSDGIRQRALKDGAVSVATKTVGPNQSETIVVFAKKAARKAFYGWLQSSLKGELVEGDM